MDCSPPGSSVYGVFQAKILEQIATPFSRGSSQPRDQTLVSCIVGRFFFFFFFFYHLSYREVYENYRYSLFSSPHITSWQIYGETVETVADFIFLGSKITENGDCGHEIKRHLLLGRKVMTNLDSTLKSRDITLPTKVPLVKAMVFPGVMYGC